jgi:hypothetical protein
MQQQELFEARKSRDKLRETRLEFSETESDAALSFAQVAATAYLMGHKERGASAASLKPGTLSTKSRSS